MQCYPDTGSSPSSVIPRACDFFFSASVSQRVSEDPGLGVDEGLVKNGDPWPLLCCYGDWWQGGPSSWLALCWRQVHSHHLQTLTEHLLPVGHSFTCGRTF